MVASAPIRPRPAARPGVFFDENSSLITYGKQRFIQMILHDVTHRREMMDELLRPSAWRRPEPSPPASRTRSTIRSRRFLRWCNRCSRRERFHPSHHAAYDSLADHPHLGDAEGSFQLRAARRRAAQSRRSERSDHRDAAAGELQQAFRRRQGRTGLAPDLKPVFADNNEIQQVVLNLLFNAADATQHAGGDDSGGHRNHPAAKWRQAREW